MQLTESLEYAVQSRPAHEATIFGERTRTWAQVADRVPRLAGGLRSAGVVPGDRVAVLALNSDRHIELYYAIAWAGAVIVPLNTRWAVPENVYALGDAASAPLLVDDEFLDQVPALREQSGVRIVVYMGEGDVPKWMLGYETLVANSQPIPNACGSDDDLYGIFYTGGTTGFPKGGMLSQGNFVFAAASWITSLPLDEDTRYLHAAGLFHLGGARPSLQ